jgi:hypothetical protein
VWIHLLTTELIYGASPVVVAPVQANEGHGTFRWEKTRKKQRVIRYSDFESREAYAAAIAAAALPIVDVPHETSIDEWEDIEDELSEPSRIEVLQAEIVLGDDARRWLESDLGRAVIGMAAQEKAEAMEALLDISSSDSLAILELQSKAKRADSFAGWITELIQKGADAEKILISEDGNE